MVGHAAGEAVGALGHIKPVHFLAILLGLAAGAEAAGEADSGLAAVEKIAIEGKDAVSGGEVRLASEARTVGGAEGLIGDGVAERFVFRPSQAGKVLFEGFAEALAGGGGIGLDEESERGSLALVLLTKAGNEFLKGPGGRRAAEMKNRFGAVGIVEVEDGGLGEAVGAAMAGGVEGIAFELDGASIDGCGDERHGSEAGGHRSGVVEIFARDGKFGGVGKGDEVGFGAAASGEAHTGEGHGSTEELHEVPPGITAIFVNVGSAGKFLVQPFLEVGRIFEFAQAAPHFGAFLAGGVQDNFFHR